MSDEMMLMIGDDGKATFYDDTYDIIIHCESKEEQDDALRLLKQPEQRWIPVTEALPDCGKTVLITNDKGNVRSGRFRGVEFWKDDGVAYWTFKGNTVEQVLAWMPLPEPMRGTE